MKIRIVAVAVIGCAAAAGCGTSAAHTAATPVASQLAATPVVSESPALSTCTIYAQQHDARIAVSPGDQAKCDELIKDLAGGGAFWSYTPNRQAVGDLQQACDMTSPNGTYEAVVLDDSGGFIGQDVCSGMASSGWTTSPTPGPLAQQISQQQADLASASASASAAAAQASQAAGVQAALQRDVATLASDTTTLDGDTTLAGDIKTMRSGLATEQSDAGAVPEASCEDGSRGADAAQVDADASQVDADASQVASDVQALQDNPVGGDISSVQSDLSQLSGLGASPDTGTAGALAAGRKALADLAAAISWAQDQASGLDGQAHAIAQHADAQAAGC